MDNTAYENYLQSAAWRLTRNAKLRDAGYRCQRCPSRRNLHVHHRSYERLGHELPEDLEVLCEQCHRGEHRQQLHDQPESRVYLAVASKLLARDPWVSVADLVAAVKDECARLRLPYRHHEVDRAVNVLVGANRLKGSPLPQTREEVIAEQYRPLTHAECVETLTRLGIIDAIRPMEHGTAKQEIEIYGALPPEDFSYEVF
jgi:hypothetical protein